MSSPPDDEKVLVRPEDDDHDLLTYGEVGARLSEEIAAEKGRLAEHERRLASGEGSEAERDRSAARLEQLRGAMERNSRPPITDENFERFFGYKGQARRNT
jgi:hypothetical protein